jgi:hypothetical protein
MRGIGRMQLELEQLGYELGYEQEHEEFRGNVSRASSASFGSGANG